MPAPVACPCLACAGQETGPDSVYLARHALENPHNVARVQGWPSLSPADLARRNAESAGRRAPPGTPCPPNQARPGSAWAAWFTHGNGPARYQGVGQ
jgi:hypothetical protein